MVDIGKWRTTKSTWGCGTFPPFKDPGRELQRLLQDLAGVKKLVEKFFASKFCNFTLQFISMDIIGHHVRANFMQLA